MQLLLALLLPVSVQAQTDAPPARTTTVQEAPPEVRPTPPSKRKRQTLKEAYYLVGLCYETATGGDDAPYKGGAGLAIQYGFPLAKRKLLLHFDFSSELLFPANTGWYARSVGVPQGDVGSVGVGIAEQLNVGLMPVILNRRRVALAAGLYAGLRYQYLAGYGSSSAPDYYTFTTGHTIMPYFGAKAMLYAGEVLTVFAAYNKVIETSAQVLGGPITYPVPANYDMLQVGVAMRFENLWP